MKNSLVLVLGIVVATCFAMGQTCIPPTPSPTPAPTASPAPTPTPAPIVGDAVNGATVYASNSCEGCHGADGSGPPNIVGESSTEIDAKLRGSASHAGGKFAALTDQDIADLAAFLAP